MHPSTTHRSLLFLVVLLWLSCVVATPLDDYVNAPDPTFKWTLNSTFRGELPYTAYILELISQTWLTPADTDASVWRHWVTVCVPDDLDTSLASTSFMYIDGGDTNDAPPTSVDQLSEVICLTSNTVCSALTQIPNQPVVFASDPTHQRRSEDSMIAFTWAHFINDTSEPNWLARLPMTKAAVKAMDAITQFAATLPSLPAIENFVVAGASKRGWTTWTTAAVDKRVIACVPMVMPILNIVPNMNHHYQAYGGWSFALQDYLKLHLMAYLNSQQFLDMAAIVDPWSYRTRLTMPKLIMTATGDEFFLPDSPQFFMNSLPGEKFLTIIPDAEHSLATALLDVADSINAFYHLIITNTPRPRYTYQIIKGNTTASIVVTVKDQPTAVTMWYAYTLSDKLRDFRLVICDQIPECIQPVIWWPITLTPTSPNVYTANMNAPPVGWIGFLVELTYTYDDDALRVLRVTSEVNIVPDIMPFPPCGQHCQPV